jgi:agmatine deiminase
MTAARPALTEARMPAEWQPHRATWLAWPHDAEFWGDAFDAAKGELAALCRALGESEPLEMLIGDARSRAQAEAALEGARVRFHEIPFDDIWMRDIGPVFAFEGTRLVGVRFRFNGWGGKWEHARDAEVAPKVAAAAGAGVFEVPLFLEGGALEFDGEGTCMTTRSCALNVNRNPGLREKDVEDWLERAFGVRRTIWLERGFDCDHTDGHVDNLARFFAPGRVLCMKPEGRADPNADVLDEIADALARARDAFGRPLELVRVPSPGEITDDDGEPMAASYMNYVIANGRVIVPTFGVATDAAAVETIAECFRGRRTVGLSARAILAGGGSFHCITQQEPDIATGGAP